MKVSTVKNPVVPVVGLSRKLEITKAAYELIAEKGFEGFRTRPVADAVGINSATLHYYFPTKNALIRGVVEHIVADLASSTLSKISDRPVLAIDELAFEFDDVRQRMRDAPSQFIVLTELSIRAWRDPTVAHILEEGDIQWHTYLKDILGRGVAEGAFRKELDLNLTASLIIMQIRGLALYVRLDHEKFDTMAEALAVQVIRGVSVTMRHGQTEG
jgi:AcrR family transcriptional regulator